MSTSIKSKPIDEVLKSTMAIFDSCRKDESCEEITTSDLNENLKNIKNRAQKLLNTYSDILLNKKKL